jgi:hyperosmotically inducible periplasmic protein
MHRFSSLFMALLIACSVCQLHAAGLSELDSIENHLMDAVITTKITAIYTKNKHLNPLKISVATEDGVVTLSGYVKNKNSFVDALRIAKSIKGVKSVNTDELDIKKVNTGFTDAYITAKVEASVLKAKVLDDESIPLVGINATTENGVVTLTQQLKSDKSIAAILKRASAIKGVKKIISHLSVKEKNS